jgi:hypothetical protein
VNRIRNFRVVYRLWLMAGRKTTEDDLTEKIDRCWATDPVHLSKGAFMALYEALVSVAMDEAREKW